MIVKIKRRVFILMLLILAVSNINAQMIASYKEILEDSTDFVHIFSSVKEYNFQNSNRHSNGVNFKRSFIHAKAWYAVEIANFLIQEGECGQEIEIDEGEDYVDFINSGCPGVVYGGVKKIPLNIRVYVDMDNRVKSINITGETETLITLFIKYWEDARIKIDKVNKNSIVYSDLLDDRITFNWKNDKPTITITQNPNIRAYRQNVIAK